MLTLTLTFYLLSNQWYIWVQFASVHEADLVAKFYFASRKLVWEVLANGMKSKMEMQWSDISAIRATVEENKPGILEIEVANYISRPRSFLT